jgi:hypothetical protein
LPHWTKVLIHDSNDNKGVLRRSDEIREYHLGWKDIRAGEPLTEAVATHLISQGESGISRPWKECGDHWHVVQRGDLWDVHMMRPMTANGAHAHEGNLNKSAISVRLVPERGVVGNDTLFERLTVLCKFLLKTYHISPMEVYAHHEVVPGSDCPKAYFDVKAFRTHLISQLFKANDEK